VVAVSFQNRTSLQIIVAGLQLPKLSDFEGAHVGDEPQMDAPMAPV
jgi:hypothetical protein